MIALLVIVLLLFGHRIPGMARALGSGITEFKRGLNHGEDSKRLPPNQPPNGDQTGKPQS
jgi:TatA/E family protein of Tat protein translocase